MADIAVFERFVRKTPLLHRGFVSSKTEHPFDSRNFFDGFPPKVKKLFDDGHYAESVFEACKFFDKTISDHTGIPETGFKLMMNAFNSASPPIKLSSLSGDSGEDEQEGFRFIAAGMVRAIRNPKGHEFDQFEDVDVALDSLSLVSFLIRKIQSETKGVF